MQESADGAPSVDRIKQEKVTKNAA